MGIIPSSFASASKNPSRVIVALGDSTTAGTPGFRSPVEAPPEGSGNPESQYTFWLEKNRPDWQVLNRGVAGERIDPVLARFERDVLSNRPDVVILLAGVNDLFQGSSAVFIKRGLSRLYDRAEQAGIPAVACTILPYDRASSVVLDRLREVNDWIREEAAKRGMGFADTSRAAADPDGGNRLSGTPDGLHPDPAGYRRMAETLQPVLEAVLDKPEARVIRG